MKAGFFRYVGPVAGLAAAVRRFRLKKLDNKT
jgi:hypothetical protein